MLCWSLECCLTDRFIMRTLYMPYPWAHFTFKGRCNKGDGKLNRS